MWNMSESVAFSFRWSVSRSQFFYSFSLSLSLFQFFGNYFKWSTVVEAVRSKFYILIEFTTFLGMIFVVILPVHKSNSKKQLSYSTRTCVVAILIFCLELNTAVKRDMNQLKFENQFLSLSHSLLCVCIGHFHLSNFKIYPLAMLALQYPTSYVYTFCVFCPRI